MTKRYTSEQLINFLTDHSLSEPPWFIYEKNNDNIFEFTISNCEIQDDLIISKLTFLSIITFKKVFFSSKVEVLSGFFDSPINFHNCSFLNTFIIHNIETPALNLRNNKLTKEFSIKGGLFDKVNFVSKQNSKITITGGKFNNSLYFDLKEKDVVAIYNKDVSINELILHVRNANIGLLNEAAINKITFNGIISSDNKIRIKQVFFNSLEILNFTNEGSFILDNCKPFKYPIKDTAIKKDKLKSTRKLKFTNSFIGDFKFSNMKLEKFDSILVENTDLSTIALFNTTFPIDKILGDPNTLYENFNRLSIVVKDSLNRRDEIEYYKASRNALRKYLKEEKKHKRSSRFSLWISRQFSDYGTNWWRATWVTFSISFILFCMMLVFTNYHFDCSYEGFIGFGEVASNFFQFLNPTHSFDFMDIEGGAYSKNPFFVTINFIARIIIGFGIFEIIQSFRKYVKK